MDSSIGRLNIVKIPVLPPNSSVDSMQSQLKFQKIFFLGVDKIYREFYMEMWRDRDS